MKTQEKTNSLSLLCFLEFATDYAEIALGVRRGKRSTFVKKYSKEEFLNQCDWNYSRAVACLSR